MNKRVDLAGSVVIGLFGIAVLVGALRFPPQQVVFDPIGPMGFPIALGVLLVVGAALQSYRSLRFLRQSPTVYGPEEGTADEPEHPASTRRGLGFVAGGVLYPLAWPSLGFQLSTVVAVTAALWALGFRGWPARVTVAVIFTTVGYLLFQVVLGVPLPAGVLRGLFNALGLS